MRALEALGLGPLRRALVARASGATLDLGCGTGRNLPLLAARPLAGVDPGAESLRAARRRAPGVPLVRARAEALPFRDGSFQTVVLGLVLCSVTDVPAALAEVRRVLCPGGAVQLLEHVRARARWLARLQDWVQPAWTRVTGGCHPNRDTEAALAAAGFVVDPETRVEAGAVLRVLTAHPAE